MRMFPASGYGNRLECEGAKCRWLTTFLKSIYCKMQEIGDFFVILQSFSLLEVGSEEALGEV